MQEELYPSIQWIIWQRSVGFFTVCAELCCHCLGMCRHERMCLFFWLIISRPASFHPRSQFACLTCISCPEPSVSSSYYRSVYVKDRHQILKLALRGSRRVQSWQSGEDVDDPWNCSTFWNDQPAGARRFGSWGRSDREVGDAWN